MPLPMTMTSYSSSVSFAVAPVLRLGSTAPAATSPRRVLSPRVVAAAKPGERDGDVLLALLRWLFLPPVLIAAVGVLAVLVVVVVVVVVASAPDEAAARTCRRCPVVEEALHAAVALCCGAATAVAAVAFILLCHLLLTCRRRFLFYFFSLFFCLPKRQKSDEREWKEKAMEDSTDTADCAQASGGCTSERHGTASLHASTDTHKKGGLVRATSRAVAICVLVARAKKKFCVFVQLFRRDLHLEKSLRFDSLRGDSPKARTFIYIFLTRVCRT